MVSSLILALAMQPDAAAIRILFEQHLVRRRELYGANDARTAEAARDLGLFLKEQHALTEAATALQEAVRIDEKLFGEGGRQTLEDVAALAEVKPREESAQLWQRAAQSADPALASRALAALGLARKALAKEEQVPVKENPRVAVRLNELAAVVEPKEAIPLLQRAVAINIRLLGLRHPETATTQVNLADQLMKGGRAKEAVAPATSALSAFEETLGAEHPRTAAACTVLAFSLRASGDPRRVEQLYRRALTINESAMGRFHEDTREDARNLADFLRESGRAKDASEIEKRYRLPAGK